MPLRSPVVLFDTSEPGKGKGRGKKKKGKEGRSHCYKMLKKSSLTRVWACGGLVGTKAAKLPGLSDSLPGVCAECFFSVPQLCPSLQIDTLVLA